MAAIEATVFGILGSLLAEIVKQFQKFRTLSDKEFTDQLKSVKLWFYIGLLAILGGSIGYAAFGDSGGELSLLGCLGAGAGSVSFFRNLGSALAGGKDESMSKLSFKNSGSEVSWREILR